MFVTKAIALLVVIFFGALGFGGILIVIEDIKDSLQEKAKSSDVEFNFAFTTICLFLALIAARIAGI